MNKQMKNVFCILLTAMMLFAQCSYALGEQAAEADTPILMGINEDMLYVWAEKLGFSKPLKNLFTTKSYDDYFDKVQDYQPNFFSCDGATLKGWLDKEIIEPFTPTDAMLNEIASMTKYVQMVFRNELMTDDGKLLGYPDSGCSICSWPPFHWLLDSGRLERIPV